MQPPKQKQGAAAPKAGVKRKSKLAKEHDVSTEDEVMIEQVWETFREKDEDIEDRRGLLKTNILRNCLVTLNAPAANDAEMNEFIEIADPEETGWVDYEQFYAIAALKLNARHDDPDAKDAEINQAYHLFTNGQEREITINDLKRVAAQMKEDVPEAVLKDMIREAKGGELGTVSLDDFQDVMKRAGQYTITSAENTATHIAGY